MAGDLAGQGPRKRVFGCCPSIVVVHVLLLLKAQSTLVVRLLADRDDNRLTIGSRESATTAGTAAPSASCRRPPSRFGRRENDVRRRFTASMRHMRRSAACSTQQRISIGIEQRITED